MEFRAFVKDGQIVGLSQKDDTACYEFLLDEGFKTTIYSKVTDSLTKRVLPSLKEAWTNTFSEGSGPNVVIDVYVDIAPKHRVFVQDISPFHSAISSCLFDWNEITHSKHGEPEFRTLSSDSAIRRPKNYDLRFPMELSSMEQLQQIID